MSNWLNYHHLLYFWTVARLGTIAAAGKELHLSQPTISGQLKLLEQSLGHPLFRRQGRRLALTDAGRVAYRYADDIFRLGNELKQAMARGALAERVKLMVGIADVVPKLIAERLLQPAMEAVPGLYLEVQEGPLPQLLAKLAVHELDVVLADQPAPYDVKVRAFTHRLGESGISFFGGGSLASGGKKPFPQVLQGAPLLLPGTGTATRRHLEAWLEKKGITAKAAGEFADSALAKVFGAKGFGVFVAPTVIESEVARMYQVRVLGRTDDVREGFFAISVERRLTHPAVVALAAAARTELFG